MIQSTFKIYFLQLLESLAFEIIWILPFLCLYALKNCLYRLGILFCKSLNNLRVTHCKLVVFGEDNSFCCIFQKLLIFVSFKFFVSHFSSFYFCIKWSTLLWFSFFKHRNVHFVLLYFKTLFHTCVLCLLIYFVFFNSMTEFLFKYK